MPNPELSHWIGGSWRPGRSEIAFEGQTFVAPARKWPRADARDANEAIRSGVDASAAWASASRATRVAHLRAWLDALLADETLCASFESAFALTADEAHAWRDAELFHARQSLEIVADDVAERAGVGLFGAHWSDGAGRLAGRAVGALAAGATWVVVADPLFGRGGEALARAAERSELPPGVLNVLFDDGRAALDACLADARVDFARLAGDEARLADLGRKAHAGLALALRPTVSITRVLADELDPVRAAADLLETSFGRSATLSGQLPGRIGRVLCPRRHFSRFCEELLGALDRHPDVVRPVPLIEPDALDALREAWFLGLDEGATPLSGGDPWFANEEGARGSSVEIPRVIGGGGPGRDRGGVRRALGVRPVVFTNVDPRTRIGRFRRAVPVLGLLRVPDARAGAELARTLDA
ncbi:MAG: aldehyde dehydrogenase family protein [Planctomycetes bacterium]|nr:aldehyde dehydrogenase family protein [Planctomycetota bacterium]